MIEELLQMQMDMGESAGATPAGFGLPGGWDYYEEANEENSTEEGELDSMPDLESITDSEVEAHVIPSPHAARVEDAEDDNEAGDPTPQRGLPSGRGILRHIDSDDDEDPQYPFTAAMRDAPPFQSVRYPPPAASTAPAEPPTNPVASEPITLGDPDLFEPQRLQRWLLTTGLAELQADLGGKLMSFVQRIRRLPSNQQDWTVRIIGQRAGGALEKEIRDVMG